MKKRKLSTCIFSIGRMWGKITDAWFFSANQVKETMTNETEIRF